jgi:hypothetical protein
MGERARVEVAGLDAKAEGDARALRPRVNRRELAREAGGDFEGCEAGRGGGQRSSPAA